MNKHQLVVPALAALFAASALSACKKDEPAPATTGERPSAATASESAKAAAAAPSAAVSAAAAEGGACKVEEDRVLEVGFNERTGLTATALPDGTTAVGVALGNRPRAAIVDAQGQTTLKDVPVSDKSLLTAGVKNKEDGVVELNRVTVAAGANGALVAYTDYKIREWREPGKSEGPEAEKRRRIACVDAGEDKSALLFDGEPVFVKNPLPKDGAAAASASASAPSVPAPAPVASASASGSAAGTAAPAPKKPTRKYDPKLTELRECRSFVHDGTAASVWGIGSELTGEHTDSGIQWFERFFIQPQLGSTKGRNYFHTAKLGLAPKRVDTLHVPVAKRFSDGSIFLAGRFRGQLRAWSLQPNGVVKSRPVYSGSSYSVARLAPAGEGVELVATRRTERTDLIRVLLGAPAGELPNDVERITIPDETVGDGTPLVAGASRTLVYRSGTGKDATLKLVELDASRAPKGAPFTLPVVEGEVTQALAVLAGTKTVVLSLRRTPKGVALGATRVSCAP